MKFNSILPPPPPPPPPPKLKGFNRKIWIAVLLIAILLSAALIAFLLPNSLPNYFVKGATISGNAILPALDIAYTDGLPGGGLKEIKLSDLSYNTLETKTYSESRGINNYSFTVQMGKSYILTAVYDGGQVISALTPTVQGDLAQDISVDTEVAKDLIVATEDAKNNLEPASLSRPLDDLISDANQEVMNLNAFYDDRTLNTNVDRTADAIHSLVMDKLNRGSGVSLSDLNRYTIRAYGGGLQGIRSLNAMLNDPKIPLNSFFTFTRYNSEGKMDFGISTLSVKRWDYLGSGIFPHIAVGGTSMVYAASASLQMGYGLGVYKNVLGSTEEPVLLSPSNLDCLDASWSPDETKIAFSACKIVGNDKQLYNIYVMDADGGNINQLTHYDEPAVEAELLPVQGAVAPSWSPDGSKIVFSTFYLTENSNTASFVDKLEIINSDGTNQQIFFDGASTGWSFAESTPSWSPDGGRILFDAIPNGQDDWEICVTSIDFKGGDDPNDTVWVLTENAYNDKTPAWSVDGRFVIFSSDRGRERATLHGQEYSMPFYVINSYTREVVTDFGDFANAGFYYGPRFAAAEAFLVPATGNNLDSSGNVIISGSDPRLSDSPSPDALYQVIIPKENDMVFNNPTQYTYDMGDWG